MGVVVVVFVVGEEGEGGALVVDISSSDGNTLDIDSCLDQGVAVVVVWIGIVLVVVEEEEEEEDEVDDCCCIAS